MKNFYGRNDDALINKFIKIQDEKLIKKIKILEKKFSLGIDLKLNKYKGLLSFKFNNKEELDELIKKLND